MDATNLPINPLNWGAMEFLALYAFLIAAAGCFLYCLTHGFFSEPARSPSGDARRLLRDPYLLAYLRGGMREALATVAFSLNKRVLLSCEKSKLSAVGGAETWKALRDPVELEMLSQCASPRKISRLLSSKPLKLATKRQAEPLLTWGLIASDAEMRMRGLASTIVGASLFTFGAARLCIDIPGRVAPPYSIFLVMLTSIPLLMAHVASNRHRTNAGDRALKDQQTLFGMIKSRVKRVAAHLDSNEDVLVAASFGLAALPAAAYPFAARLHRNMEGSAACSAGGCGGGCGAGCGGGCGGC